VVLFVITFLYQYTSYLLLGSFQRICFLSSASLLPQDHKLRAKLTWKPQTHELLNLPLALLPLLLFLVLFVGIDFGYRVPRCGLCLLYQNIRPSGYFTCDCLGDFIGKGHFESTHWNLALKGRLVTNTIITNDFNLFCWQRILLAWLKVVGGVDATVSLFKLVSAFAVIAWICLWLTAFCGNVDGTSNGTIARDCPYRQLALQKPPIVLLLDGW